jgi:pimeloyl-ACP methyl ester carboxylesterase
MAASPPPDLDLAYPTTKNLTIINAPIRSQFTSAFGHAFPRPHFLSSELGTTALYNLPPPSPPSGKHILMIHGINTPALGMLPLAQQLQILDPSSHIVLFDLYGRGLSSTPVQAHTPHIFHLQIYQVLSYMQWTTAHIIGYSFGGSAAVSFVVNNPWIAESVILVAPAGLLGESSFDARTWDLIWNSKGREEEARTAVLK